MHKSKLSRAQKIAFVKWLWLLVIGTLLLITLFFFAIIKGWIGYVPPLHELENPKNQFATEIYSSDMEVIGTFFIAKENRVNTTYDELSPHLIEALIATEDIRFYNHPGIDGKATLRAIFRLGGKGGGSTLTQQLAKLLWSPPTSSLIGRIRQKMTEWVIAVELERLYTKEEILTMYLNKFDFLNNAVGIKTAARVYFNTTPKHLNIEQSAMLVGMCQNPSRYNPASRREETRNRTLNRRNTVLNQMRKADFLTRAEYDSIKQLPITLDFQRVDHKLGLAPYFREYLRSRLQAAKPKRSNYNSWQTVPYGKYYMDSLAWETDPLYGFLEKNFKSDGTKYSLYSDGLKIYTTIDSRMQRYAEEAIQTHLKDLQGRFFKEQRNRKIAPFETGMKESDIAELMTNAMKQSDRYRIMKKNSISEDNIIKAFNTPEEMTVFTYGAPIDTVMTPMDSIRYYKFFARTGFMSMEAASGHVKAYAGGPDFTYFQYDMVTMGRRQVGSTVKPFLYTLAMNEGFWPCDMVKNQSYTLQDALGRDFTPRNSSNARLNEMVTIRWGLQQSNNYITAYLMSCFTPQQLVKLMRSFGIQGDIPAVVSLCLGPNEVSVAEMVDAYTTFPNKGIRVNPVFVTHIEDGKGNLIASFVPTTEEVIDEQTSYKMLDMMSAVMDGGTGSRVRYLYGVKAPACGKTGTTQNNADGWFIGYTPSLVSGVWVGWEDRTVHFNNMAEGQGASMALPIWAMYMKKVLENPDLGYSSSEQFDFPSWFDASAGCRD
ncbi:MAG: transglycosylase domain-containing protein [Prevotellaceae bacterium]|jgi:penicillin-binding protein 1A|nr:transglycosylase domain-containing protein [Prevotellaceae bacterium]